MTTAEPFGFDLVEALAPEETDSWEPIDLTTLPEHPPVQPTLGKVGDIGLVYPGKRHVFSGPQESAKTLVAYIVGLQVIREGGTIILIDFEMGAWDARNRLRELGATQDDLHNLKYLEPDKPATQPRLTALLDHQPQLVIIDAAAGAYDLQGLDDNKRQDVEKFSGLYVKGFWQHGIATIVLDHVVKNTDNRGKYAIGSERKTGGVDVHLGFDTILPIKRGSKGLYKIVTHKDRDGYLKRGTLAELELHSDPDSHRITWTWTPAEEVPEGEPWMPTKVMEKISSKLEQLQEPVSRNTIITEIGGRAEVARTAIDQLVRLKYVTETAGPRNSKLLESTRAFTVYGWENEHPTNDLVPPSPDLVPDEVVPPNPTSSPPYRGTGWKRDEVDDQKTTDLVPHFDTWIDSLQPEPQDDPPGDLHDDPANDDIPF